MNFKTALLFMLLFFLSGEAVSQHANTSRSTGRARLSSTKKKITENDIIGSWKLVRFKHGPQSKKRMPLTSCDTSMPWVFYKDSSTRRLLVKCQPIENCNEYGFESEWLFNTTSLIIKKTKIMGMGGISSNGKFNLKELTPETMVLEFMNHQYVFRRLGVWVESE
jgi:hypothetical protein